MGRHYLRKITVLISALIPISLLVFVLTQYPSATPDEGRTVLTVNGESVSKAEVSHMLSDLRPTVFSYFSQKYGAKDGPEFWSTRFGDEVPIEVLKQRTLERLKRTKVQQILMRQYGLVNDISYSSFLESLEEENARRKESLKENIPIYGPVEFQAKVFYEYLMSERIEKLKSLLSATRFSIAEKEVLKFFNKNRSTRYRKMDCIRLEKIIHRTSREAERAPSGGAAALQVMSEIKRRIQNGEEVKMLIKTFQNRRSGELVLEIHQLDGENLREQADLYSEIEAHVKNLTAGEVSEVFEGKQGLSIIRIAAIESDQYKSYREVREQVYRDLIDVKYEQMVTRLVDKVTIDIREEFEL